MGSRLPLLPDPPPESGMDEPAGDEPMTSALGEVFDRHPLPHVAFDVATREIVAANDAAVSYYGWPRDALLRMRRDDLLDPGEHAAMQRFMDALAASRETGPERVWRERHRDGHELRSDVRGLSVDLAGRPVRVTAMQDAWPRVRAQEDAHRQRELLAVAGRMARLGGWRLDLATGYAHHSDEVRAIHELDAGEGFDLGGALAFYPAPGRETLVAALEACRERGEPFDLELPFVTARGRDRWVRACGEAVTDESGRIVALHGALQDITEQHQGELALAESRARLDAVVRVLPDLWVVFDADDRYVDVSDPNHPALSAPWSEKVGRRLHETIEPALARQMRAAANEARDTGQLRGYFYEMDTHQGGRRHFEGRSVPMDGGRWMTLVRDVTEIVHLEQRFRTLTEALPVGLFETDARGWSTYVNPAWQDLFGLHGTAGLGAGWASAVHPDDLDRIRSTWAEAVSEGGHFAQEFRVRRPDGVERRAAARSNPIRRVDGQVIGHVGSVVDVTQAHELDQARRAREVAEEAARRQAAFLSRLSHELRTPLNAIIGFTDLLLMQQPAGSPAGPLGHVRDAGAHMLALVNDLLQLQQLQQGHLPLRIEPVEVLGVVQACTALLDPLVRRCEARVMVDVPAALTLSTDRRTLQQMLLNLASNALKYGRDRDGLVTLRATASDGWVRLEVCDDGPGMTPEQQRRLFQPFERLGQERGGQPGSGLGLVITQQLVEALGGHVAIDSTPGEGTRATVMLPAEADGLSAPAPRPPVSLPAIAGTPIEP